MQRTVTATATPSRSASRSRCGGVPRRPVGQRTSNWTASNPTQPASGSWSGAGSQGRKLLIASAAAEWAT